MNTTNNTFNESIIFARVSGDSQNTDRQVEDLKQTAQHKNIKVLRVFTEKISGATKTKNRPILQEAIGYCIEKKVKNVLVTELSRLGRNPAEVLNTIQTFNEAGVNLFIRDLSIDTLNPDGSVNVMAEFMVNIMTSFTNMERRLIKERLTSGRNQWVKNGGEPGRPKGSGMSDKAFFKKYAECLKHLKRGESLNRAALLSKVHRNTALKVYERAIKAGLMKRRPQTNNPEYKKKEGQIAPSFNS